MLVLKTFGRTAFNVLMLLVGGMGVSWIWNLGIVPIGFPPIPTFVGSIIFLHLLVLEQDENWWNSYAITGVTLGSVYTIVLLLKLLLT